MANKSRIRARSEAKANSEIVDNLATFTLPDSLPCSEVAFPILIHKPIKCSWQSVLNESEEKYQEIQAYTKARQEPEIKSIFLKTECDYIKNEVFVYLLPAMEETLNKAKLWNAINQPRCFFNGLDWIVQTLWNNNPRYPIRKDMNLHVFNMPWVRKYLLLHPRPLYPKSWIWPEEYAATLIQKTVRQYFVQREDDVQEMREFWKKLDLEKDRTDMEINPFLAKKFASERNISKIPDRYMTKP